MQRTTLYTMHLNLIGGKNLSSKINTDFYASEIRLHGDCIVYIAYN